MSPWLSARTTDASLPARTEADATRIQDTAVPTNASLERRDQPVTDEDVRILRRANDILASPAVWNRHDTRICKPSDKTWTLFCALEKRLSRYWVSTATGKSRFRKCGLRSKTPPRALTLSIG